jgi:hypothetical protein
MPGFAIGCPQRLAVGQGPTRRPTAILGMAADLTGKYLAILTHHDIQVTHEAGQSCWRERGGGVVLSLDPGAASSDGLCVIVGRVCG